MQERYQEKKQRNYTKNEEKKIISKTSQEVIGKSEWFEGTKIISHFGCTNNIFADCTDTNFGVLFSEALLF